MVARAIAFQRACMAAAADTAADSPLGRWHRSARHPRMWVLNELWVSGRRPQLTATELLAELDRGLADSPHRRATVEDDATGRRLADELAGDERWRAMALLVMVLDREPPEPAAGVAREVGEEAFAPLSARIVGADRQLPAADRPAVIAGDAHIRTAVPGTRRFVGARDGVDACVTTLYTDGSTGQPEDVGTLAAHRGHGLAAATVSLAAREALAAGCELVFIVCDARSGPVGLYAGLGFRALGRYWTFTRPA